MNGERYCESCGTAGAEVRDSAKDSRALCFGCLVGLDLTDVDAEPTNCTGCGSRSPWMIKGRCPDCRDKARSRRLSVRTADASRARPIRWLWESRLPFGYLSLLLGAEGGGKGTLLSHVVARATVGDLPGALQGEPSRVLWVGDEDSSDSVVTPRLHAAGANLGLIDFLEGELSFRDDALDLAALLDHGKYGLIIFDALLDNLGVGTDDWRSKAVRDELRPLRRILLDRDCAAIGSLHPNKGQRGSFRDLVSGSFAFNASSRSSLFLAPHPSDSDRRVLVRGKGNLSAAPPAYEFGVDGTTFELNGHTFNVPVVCDPEESEIGIEDVLKPDRAAPVKEHLAEKLDALGTGEIQSRADLARALGRKADDRSVDRALNDLEADGRWEKVGRGKWRCLRIGIGVSKATPMSNNPELGSEAAS